MQLQEIPSDSNFLTAWMPSQVPATFIRIRLFGTPDCSYVFIICLAFSTVASVLKDKSASTSVETYPGTILLSSIPKAIASWSDM